MIPRQTSATPRPAAVWKHGATPVLGLIGEIGGGKSTVAGRLVEHGASVIDADVVGHQRLAEPSIRDRIVERFGPGVRDVSQLGIDRHALGAIVFHDPNALRDLEAILHPSMRERFVEMIAELSGAPGRPLIVLDAAVLLEAGWDDLCDRIVFVEAPRPERLRRVSATRGWSEETLAARERSQWSAEAKRQRADRVIVNDGSRDRLEIEVDRLLDWLREAGRSVASSTSAPNLVEMA